VDTLAVSRFFATLTLACWAGLVVLAVVWWAAPRSPGAGRLLADVRQWALPLAAAVALTTTLGSLYYSEIADFVPCRLCWYQRIAMYPLPLILGIAAWRRDADIRWYALPIAGVGAAISVYHSWLQAFPPESGSTFCTPDAPCTARHVWEFGFVSIPFMALTAFLTVGALVWLARPSDRSPA
jgi:disulfide bond formation protein DsbB